MGTHVLLESAKIAKISRFIHVSTDEVYGEQTLDQEAMSEEQVQRTLLLSFLFYIGLIPTAFLQYTLIPPFISIVIHITFFSSHIPSHFYCLSFTHF